MRYEIILIGALFMILVGIQYTLSKILVELRNLRKAKDLEHRQRRPEDV